MEYVTPSQTSSISSISSPSLASISSSLSNVLSNPSINPSPSYESANISPSSSGYLTPGSTSSLSVPNLAQQIAQPSSLPSSLAATNVYIDNSAASFFKLCESSFTPRGRALPFSSTSFVLDASVPLEDGFLYYDMYLWSGKDVNFLVKALAMNQIYEFEQYAVSTALIPHLFYRQPKVPISHFIEVTNNDWVEELTEEEKKVQKRRGASDLPPRFNHLRDQVLSLFLTSTLISTPSGKYNLKRE